MRATRRTKQELSLAWREAKQLVTSGDLAAARAFNSETDAILGSALWKPGTSS